MTEIVNIPFHGSEIHSFQEDGKPLVILRHLTESIGIDFGSQLRRLKSKSWATLVYLTRQDQYDAMVAVDMRTLTMWLATINEKTVSDAARPLLVAYQAEVASAIEAYWTKGGAINPRATARQLEDIASLAEKQARVLAICVGLVDPAWLEAKTRHVLARALGEEPEIDPATRPLTVGEYLTERGVGADVLRAISSTFGKKIKAAFRAKYSRDPGMSERFVDGALRPVAVYTEADRALFDQVWSVMRAQLGGGR
jgi:hypothetical protein